MLNRDSGRAMNNDTPGPGTKANPEPAAEPAPEVPAKEESKQVTDRTLEQVQIDWQASWQFKAIEWLKGAAGVAAVVGLFATVIYNSAQLAQIRESRDEERFDKAVSRLGSQSPSERLAGLSGLQLFLGPAQRDKHQAALLFLANGVAIEKDPIVRGAMLDIFASLRQYQFEQQVLNETLAVERDRNRGILKSFQARFQTRLKDGSATIFDEGNDETGIGTLAPDDLAPLQATAATIASLIRNGAHVKDLSDIYCTYCGFSSSDGSVNLSDVNFDRSFLRKASFVKANLENASFDGADLIQTDFTGANMRRAKLTDPPLVEPLCKQSSSRGRCGRPRALSLNVQT
jgi:Pentapeptide repeats (8 copies)